jgi:hypothetical protein
MSTQNGPKASSLDLCWTFYTFSVPSTRPRPGRPTAAGHLAVIRDNVACTVALGSAEVRTRAVLRRAVHVQVDLLVVEAAEAGNLLGLGKR